MSWCVRPSLPCLCNVFPFKTQRPSTIASKLRQHSCALAAQSSTIYTRWRFSNVNPKWRSLWVVNVVLTMWFNAWPPSILLPSEYPWQGIGSPHPTPITLAAFCISSPARDLVDLATSWLCSHTLVSASPFSRSNISSRLAAPRIPWCLLLHPWFVFWHPVDSRQVEASTKLVVGKPSQANLLTNLFLVGYERGGTLRSVIDGHIMAWQLHLVMDTCCLAINYGRYWIPTSLALRFGSLLLHVAGAFASIT